MSFVYGVTWLGRHWYSGALRVAVSLAGAATVNDGPGGFIPTFTGTQSPDIDILSASLDLSGTNLLFSATLNGTIGNGADTYVLGINRGLSTRNFSAVGLAGVTFDSVLTVTGAGVLGRNGFCYGYRDLCAVSNQRQQYYRCHTSLNTAHRREFRLC